MKVSKEKNRQIGLFDPVDYEKLERLDRTIDTIRKRYGNDAVMRASFLVGEIDHMSGGISRERRSVDYRTEKLD
jgi:DNA polymerase-4